LNDDGDFEQSHDATLISAGRTGRALTNTRSLSDDRIGMVDARVEEMDLATVVKAVRIRVGVTRVAIV
jgi:hypothetical protein